jgi:hypothetical protein
MRARILAVLAACAVGLGLVSVTTPATAAAPTAEQWATAAQLQAHVPPGAKVIPAAALTSFSGCGDQHMCLWRLPNYNGRNDPNVEVTDDLLQDAGGMGRALSNWGFDNATTCAMNNDSNEFLWLWFWQFNDADQRGFTWSIPMTYAICWDGWWRNDRASRWGVSRTQVYSSATTMGRNVLASAPAAAPVVTAARQSACGYPYVCLHTGGGFTGARRDYGIYWLRADPDGKALASAGIDNAVSSAVNNSNHSVILCQYVYNGGGFCWVLEPGHEYDWSGWWRDNRASWIGYAG